jgi:hypothetical protein
VWGLHWGASAVLAQQYKPLKTRPTMPIQQKYFEMRDIAPLRGRSWIPLRQATDVQLEAPNGVLSVKEFVGIVTAAIPEAKREDADKLDWNDLNLQPHRSGVEEWGYHSADVFRAWGRSR